MRKKIVIIGVGNLLMGDDGIGVITAWALMKEKLPDNVSVFDGATRAFDVLEYMDGADKAVIVDAYRKNGEPGSIYKFEFNPKNEIQDEAFNLSMHDINFLDALKAGREIYDLPSEIVIIGVEPQTLECGMGLSSRLNSMLPVIIDSVKSEIIS
ncbi:MAG: hydrogenase maturation protease [Methanobacteriota archaeon]